MCTVAQINPLAYLASFFKKRNKKKRANATVARDLTCAGTGGADALWWLVTPWYDTLQQKSLSLPWRLLSRSLQSLHHLFFLCAFSTTRTYVT